MFKTKKCLEQFNRRLRTLSQQDFNSMELPQELSMQSFIHSFIHQFNNSASSILHSFPSLIQLCIASFTSQVCIHSDSQSFIQPVRRSNIYSFIRLLRKMMLWEFKHAKQAVTSNIYVTLYNTYREHECTRYGTLPITTVADPDLYNLVKSVT